MRASALRFPRVVFAAAFLCLLLAAGARAEVKNFVFSGTITTFTDRNFLLDGSVAAGTPFVGFYVFDTTAADSNTDTTVGDYRYSDSHYGVTVKVGSYVFRTNPQHVNFLIEVVNRPSSDNYLFRSYYNVCSQPATVDMISWQLDDSSGQALANDLLPTAPPTLGSWQSLSGLTISGISNSYLIRGNITDIHETPAIIPETPAVTLGDAVEVKWQSVLGYYYQIQKSGNLLTWTDVDAPVLGDGSVMSRFYSRDKKNVFYRAEIANFQK